MTEVVEDTPNSGGVCGEAIRVESIKRRCRLYRAKVARVRHCEHCLRGGGTCVRA